jgi:hypothetical protein
MLRAGSVGAGLGVACRVLGTGPDSAVLPNGFAQGMQKARVRSQESHGIQQKTRKDHGRMRNEHERIGKEPGKVQERSMKGSERNRERTR